MCEEFDSSWLLISEAVYHEGVEPPIRIICFPHCGGEAREYFAWTTHMARYAEMVCLSLPGRDLRAHEIAVSDCETFLCGVVDELLKYMDKPFAFWGHGGGVILAYAVIKELQQRGLVLPFKFFVSGSPPVFETEYLFEILHNGQVEDDLSLIEAVLDVDGQLPPFLLSVRRSYRNLLKEMKSL